MSRRQALRLMVIVLGPGQSGLLTDSLVDPSQNPSSVNEHRRQGIVERTLRKLGGNCPDQSGFAPENLITLAHFSVSAAMRFPYSLGDSASTSPPSSAKRALIVGSARAALISRLSVSMISARVFFGAPIPAHALVSKPGTKSPSVGTSGSPCQSRRGGHRQRAQPAGPDMFDGRRHVVEHDMHLSANEIGQRRGRSPIRDMQHVDAAHHFEQL